MERGKRRSCLVAPAVYRGLFRSLRGLHAAFCHNRLFAWITCISASAFVALSIVFASGFLCCRTPGVPLTDPAYFGHLHIPVIALDGAAFVVCSVEALLFIGKIGKPRPSRDSIKVL